MSKSYRLVWSVVRSAWTVVSELAKSHAKSGAAMVMVAAVTAALPAQGAGNVTATGGNTINVVSDTYTVGDGVYCIVGNNSNIRFEEGGIFNITTTNTATLTAVNNGTVAELGAGGGTYKINTGVGSFYAIEARSGGKIDLSKAASVELTTGHVVGVWADQANSKIDLSKITVNQTRTGTTGYGIRASDKGQITIGELDLTTNQTGVNVDGLDSIATIGNTTTRSKITSSLIGVSATAKGKVNLTNIDITTTGTTNTSTGLNVLSGATATLTGTNTLTTSGAAAAKVSGTGSTINLEGSATLTATGTSASALESVSGGLVYIAGNSTIKLNSTSGAALKVSGAMEDNGETGSVYTLTSGAGEGTAVDVIGDTLDLSSAQQITVNASQKTGLSAMADAQVNLSTLTLNQTYGGADTAAVGIAATTVAQVNISQLALTGNQTGARVESSGTKVQIGNDIAASTMTVTGDNHAGLVASAGAEFALMNTTVTTTGNSANGIDISTTATGTLNKVNVTTNNADSIGVKVDDTSTINFAGTNNITTKGDYSTGLLLASGATATGTLTGKIETTGASAIGIQSGAANLAVADATVTTLGQYSIGIDVEAGQVSVLNSTITTKGDGIRANGSASRVDINNTTIETTGQVANGVTVESGEVYLNASSISTAESLSEGLRVRGSATLVEIQGTKITTDNDDSSGVTVEVGKVVLNTSKITTTAGSASHGVKVQNSGTVVKVDKTEISTSGAVSHGVLVEGGEASLENVTITTTGDGSSGVRVNDTGRINFAGTNTISSTGSNGAAAFWVEGGAIVTGTLTGSVVANDADALMFEDTSVNTKTFALSSATVSSPTNAILLKAGDLAVTATDSIMTGDIQAEAGAVLDLTMVGTDKAVSVLTGAILNARDVNIDPSTWNITANSDMVNLTNDGSDFRFVNADGSAPDASYTDFKTVTVNTYTGMNAANVYLNTRLNGDDVTGTYSDKIVVRDGGTMSGTKTFHFANAGGTGAATYDGIKFVDAQNGATVDKSNFKIAGGYVAAGAYGYVARQGQYTNLADNQSLFLTNFAPKGATVDSNGFLNGGEGVIPPKSTEVAPGSGTGVTGNFSEAPTDGASTGNSHINKLGNAVCDNGSTKAECALPATHPNSTETITYTPVVDRTGLTDDVTLRPRPTGEPFFVSPKKR